MPKYVWLVIIEFPDGSESVIQLYYSEEKATNRMNNQNERIRVFMGINKMRCYIVKKEIEDGKEN